MKKQDIRIVARVTKKQVDTTKMFLDIVDKTTHIEKLTAEIVREFIDKIVVHHRIKKDGITTQKVEIYYNVIGKFELPPLYNFDLSENETQSITY